MDEKRVLLEAIAFLESDPGKKASQAFKADAKEVLLRALRAIFNQIGKRPQDLDGEDMRSLLSDHLPMHFFKGDPLAAIMIDVMGNYLNFLEEQHVVPALFELRNALAQEGESFESRIKEGIGTGEGQSLGQKIETIRHRGNKVGRNDPCPCGSGKKFKKCCMRLGGN
jgi:hypothetical protein